MFCNIFFLVNFSMFFIKNYITYDLLILGQEKPNLVELGPYVYRQIMYKDNVNFSMDEEKISHSVYREFYFEPSKNSKLSDEETVIVPNIPLFGLIKKLSKDDSTTKKITRNLLESYKDVGFDTTPFIKVTVKELIWGYPSILLSMQRLQENKNCISTEEEAFGDFGDFNDFDTFDDFDTFGRSQNILNDIPKQEINCDIKPGNLVPFGLFSEEKTARNGTSTGYRTVKTGNIFFCWITSNYSTVE